MHMSMRAGVQEKNVKIIYIGVDSGTVLRLMLKRQSALWEMKTQAWWWERGKGGAAAVTPGGGEQGE